MLRERSKSVCFVLTLAIILCSSLSVVSAQSPVGTPITRPQAGDLPDAGSDESLQQISIQHQIPEELEILLQTWEKRSATINKIQGKFQRFDYDLVFKQVRCAEGSYWYEAPDKGRMDFLPKELPQTKDNSPPTMQVNGEAYTLVPENPQTWVCNGEAIFMIDHGNKTYNQIDIPPEFRGEKISDGPLPFLFGMKAEKMKQRYLLNLGDRHLPNADPSKAVLHIVALPLMPQERKEYQRAEVLLDPVTYMPKAVKLWGAGGNKETVYTFLEHDTKLTWGLFSPWKNPPGNYQKLHHKEAAPREANDTNPGMLIR